jgi:glyoxylase-like metal-dependent hydrolase (beta-lactamase superfamily II)
MILALSLLGARAFAAPPAVKITFLYDNTAATAAARPERGFAALIEAHGQRVIFDTGGDEDVLQYNLTALGLDLGRMNAVVLSHAHWDHTQGIAALGRQPGRYRRWPGCDCRLRASGAGRDGDADQGAN